MQAYILKYFLDKPLFVGLFMVTVGFSQNLGVTSTVIEGNINTIFSGNPSSILSFYKDRKLALSIYNSGHFYSGKYKTEYYNSTGVTGGNPIYESKSFSFPLQIPKSYPSTRRLKLIIF